MDFKRIFRGPWLWIVIAVVGVLIALQYLAPNGGYDEVDTSKMSGYIDDGTVTAFSLKLTASDDGSFRVSNPRTNFTRTYR